MMRRKAFLASLALPTWSFADPTLEQRLDSLERAFTVWVDTTSGRADKPQEYIARLRRRISDLEKRVTELEKR